MSKKNYLFFDEIQQVKDWERAINSNDTDICNMLEEYLFSSKFATFISGRYVGLKFYLYPYKKYYFNYSKSEKSKVKNPKKV